jgi:hypothetical protein
MILAGCGKSDRSLESNTPQFPPVQVTTACKFGQRVAQSRRASCPTSVRSHDKRAELTEGCVDRSRKPGRGLPDKASSNVAYSERITSSNFKIVDGLGVASTERNGSAKALTAMLR